MKIVRQRWVIALGAIVVLVGTGLAILHTKTGWPDDNAHLVAVALDAVSINGYSGFLQGSGLNVSPDPPFVSSRSPTTAVVTIPYMTNYGPVSDPKVNFIYNHRTFTWQAVSITDGDGKTSAIFPVP